MFVGPYPGDFGMHFNHWLRAAPAAVVARLSLRNMLIGTTFSLLVLAACSSTSNGDSAPANGASCTDQQACAGGLCVQSQDFPGGYCTQGCTLSNPSTCPSGSVCIDDVSGVPVDAGITSMCYQACQSDAECTRAGYKCLEKANHLVCRSGA